MKFNKINNSFQDWIPIKEVLENGIIKLNNNHYVKIIKIIPINFNLKSELEKQSILNSYKIFLKTCDFDLQILIQSKKENLSNNISIIQEKNKKEDNKNIIILSKNYINYISDLNIKNKSSSKNFFILIKSSNKYLISENNNSENMIVEELNDKYSKIKECLFRCGNSCFGINTKEETLEIIKSFLTSFNL